MARVDGKVALVTGSTSGIGLRIAHNLASQGCHVILTGLGDDGTIQNIVQEFKSEYKGKTDYIFANLENSSEVADLVKKIKEIHPNGVDILVNNAGLQMVSPVEKYPVDGFEKLLAVMLSAPFQLVKYTVSDMKKKGWGRIINVSSAAGLVALRNIVAYVSAKHGLHGMTKAVALETAGSGVTCNVICPGYTNTQGLTDKIKSLVPEQGSYETVEKSLLTSQPSGSLITVEQVASLVSYLCSDGAAQITGSVIPMDGGYTAQ